MTSTRGEQKGSLRACATAAVSFAALVAVTAQPALAQANVCVDLETRLIALERGAGQGNRQNFRSFDQSVQKQQREIDLASTEARRSGCYGAIFRKPAEKCPQLVAMIDRMRDNLRRLITERNRFTSDPNTIARQRSEILRAMSVNRCRTSEARVRRAPGQNTLFGALFGNARTRTLGEDVFFRGDAGTYRTLCVRTCDGYYFPISFSTVRSQFVNDQATCSAMCPGTDVALYAHRNPGEDAASMVSMNGLPYTALPTAFQYREKFDPTCACGSPVAIGPTGTGFLQTQPQGLQQGFDTGNVSFRTRETAGPSPGPFVALPRLRPNRYIDPETAANRAGGLVLQRPRQQGETVVADLPTVSADGVRIVGPAYYYGQDTTQGPISPKAAKSLRESGESVN